MIVSEKSFRDACGWFLSGRCFSKKRRLNHKISSCDGRAATRFLGVLSSTWLILLSVDKLVMLVNILQNKLLEITWVELSAHVKNFQLFTHCFSLTCARNHSHPQIHIIHAIHIITNHRTQTISNQKTHNSPIMNQNTQIINKQSPWKSSIIINHHFETAKLSASSASFAATLAFPISSSFSSSDPTEVFCVAAVVGGPLLPKKLNKWRTEKWWFVKVRESFI